MIGHKLAGGCSDDHLLSQRAQDEFGMKQVQDNSNFLTVDAVSNLVFLDKNRKNTRFNSDIYPDFYNNNLFPLNISEFSEAARWHPIVFIRAGSSVAAVMVTSVTPGLNGALDEAGRWKPHAYQPDYVRCYPFIGERYRKQGRSDLDGSLLGLPGNRGAAVINGGAESPGPREIRARCDAFAAARDETDAFLSALDEYKLLAFQEMVFKTSSKSNETSMEFEIVDFARLARLPDTVLRYSVAAGWTSAIEAHRASLRRWSEVLPRSGYASGRALPPAG